MKMLDHPNIVEYKDSFTVEGEIKEESYVNIVMEYLPEDLQKIMAYYKKQKKLIPMFHVKIYMYQIFRALAYMNGKEISHRDIKPSNCLLDPTKNIIKLCDFGSAKKLIMGEQNVSYITARHYR